MNENQKLKKIDKKDRRNSKKMVKEKKITPKATLGSFKKGHISWNKGKKGYTTSWKGGHHSEETKEKMSEVHKGEKNPMYGKKPWNKGLKGFLGKQKHYLWGKKRSKKTKEKISKKLKGRKLSIEHKNNIKKNNCKYWAGKKRIGFIPWNYIDGRSKNCSPARYGDDWFKIRLLIYKRDNYTCQKCALKMSKKTGAFHIHHIVPFLISFDNSLKNLITLCPPCHRKEDARIIKEIKLKECDSYGI